MLHVEAVSLKYYGVVIALTHTGKFTSNIKVDGVDANIGINSTVKVSTDSECGNIQISRNSISKYSIRIPKLKLQLRITVRQHVLLVNLRIRRDICCKLLMKGLCGKCHMCEGLDNIGELCGLGTIEPKSTPNTTVLILSPDDNESKIQKNIDNQIVCDSSIFGEINSCKTTNKSSDSLTFNDFGSGRNFFFNNSVAWVKDLDMCSSSFVVIELMIKTCSQHECFGTILSYTYFHTFSIYYEKTVQFIYADMIYDTGIEFEQLKWQQISIVFDKELQQLDVYIFNSEGYVSRRQYIMTENPFPQHGDLALGRWQVSTGGTGTQPVNQFKGLIDELRIWCR